MVVYSAGILPVYSSMGGVSGVCIRAVCVSDVETWRPTLSMPSFRSRVVSVMDCTHAV